VDEKSALSADSNAAACAAVLDRIVDRSSWPTAVMASLSCRPDTRSARLRCTVWYAW
jgi:hypothetical protein